MSRRRSVGAVGIYAGSVAASAIVTLLSIPIVIGLTDASAWAGLAAGQSIGTGASVLIGFGWGTTGPTDVARATSGDRARIYLDSYRARALLALPIAAAASVITFAVVPTARWESALNCAAYAATGLLAGWFFTGAARPRSFVLFDTAPRVLGAVAGVAVLIAGAPLAWYPLLQLVGILVGVAASTAAIAGTRELFSTPEFARTITVLRLQSHGLVLASVSAANAALPSILVASIAPSALPAYALADKLLRFGTTAASPFVQFLQGWVPGGGRAVLVARVRRAGVIGAALVVLGSVAFFFVAPWLGSVLSHDQIRLPILLVAAFAAVLVLLVGAQIVGLVCLLALGEARRLARFTLIGGVATVPLVIVGVVLNGAVGAATAVGVGELVAFVPQCVLLSKLLRARADARFSADTSS